MAVAVRASHAPSISVRPEIPGREWNAFVDGDPAATVYHRAEWAGLIKRTFGHDTSYLVARHGGDIAGILPLVAFGTPFFGRFLTSMPFVNYGGIAAASRAARAALLAAAIDEARARQVSYLELRHADRLLGDAPALTHKVAMILPLASHVDEQWAALQGKVRNQIRKAEKSALTVRVGARELVDVFYRVLSRNMRDLGSPVHSRALFDDVLATFPECSRVFAVFRGETPVAASLVLWHRDRLEVPWASSLRDYNALCPNMLLYWEMLKFGIERRFAEFDFGRSTRDSGTYQFKAQWGARPRQLHWEYWLAPGVALPDRSPGNPKFATAVRAWTRLPVGLTTVLGPRIVRNIP